MIRLLDNSRTSLFNYFYIFCILMYAGQATVFTRHLGDLFSLGNAFALIITFVFILINRIHLTKNYAYSLLVFLSYAAITSVINRQVNPMWIIEWIIQLTIAFCMCQEFGGKLLAVIETVLYHLCIIALFFWIIHIVAPDVMLSIVDTFEFSSPFDEDGNVYANILFYTVNKGTITGSVSEYAIWLVRNPGFTWEPGAFASIICLGIFCNLVRTNLSLRKNFALLVFTIALLSTQSTTGGMTFILMGAVWLLANRKIGWGIVLLPLALWVYSLPFVGGKFAEELSELEYSDYTQTVSGNLGRTYSLQLDIMEFRRHPIWGLGGWIKGTWFAQQGYEFNTISGIGRLLSQYGAIMTLLFLFLLGKSCSCIKKITGSPNAYVLIAVMIGMMYSYSMWQHPLFMAFWMFGVYVNKEKRSIDPVIS